MRKVRSSFAAPLVLTLAVAPACVVRTSSQPPPNGSPGTGSARDNDQVHTHTNPPRPPVVTPGQTNPNPDPTPKDPVVVDTVQQTPPPAVELSSWTVFQNRKDRACYARLDVECPAPPATCNPPPARKLQACPDNFRVDPTDRPVKIVERAKDDCYLQMPMPACPEGASCNPPPPQKTSCPR